MNRTQELNPRQFDLPGLRANRVTLTPMASIAGPDSVYVLNATYDLPNKARSATEGELRAFQAAAKAAGYPVDRSVFADWHLKDGSRAPGSQFSYYLAISAGIPANKLRSAGGLGEARSVVVPHTPPVPFDRWKPGAYWMNPAGDLYLVRRGAYFGGDDLHHADWAKSSLPHGDRLDEFQALELMYAAGWLRIGAGTHEGAVYCCGDGNPVTNSQRQALQDLAIAVKADRVVHDDTDWGEGKVIWRLGEAKVNPPTVPSKASQWRSGQGFWLSPGGALHPVDYRGSGHDSHSLWANAALGGDALEDDSHAQAARDLYDLGWKRVTTGSCTDVYFNARSRQGDPSHALSRVQLTALKDLALSLKSPEGNITVWEDDPGRRPRKVWQTGELGESIDISCNQELDPNLFNLRALPACSARIIAVGRRSFLVVRYAVEGPRFPIKAEKKDFLAKVKRAGIEINAIDSICNIRGGRDSTLERSTATRFWLQLVAELPDVLRRSAGGLDEAAVRSLLS